MKNGDKLILYSTEKVKCKLMKIEGKVYEITNYYIVDRPFTEAFKEMAQVRYGYANS